MPKFKFLGHPDHPEEFILRGVTFPKEKAVEVEDQDFARKLSHLAHFAEVKAGRPRKDEQ